MPEEPITGWRAWVWFFLCPVSPGMLITGAFCLAFLLAIGAFHR